ncbi:MAG: ABC transporter permease, partial [Oscillospiraceae bacterium]|nr:ABC transporter permease [Oscillospiraceae bacterium]
MNLIENIKLALASLKSNKMRAVLTMLGIIIGISSIIMITTLGNIMQKSITDTINSQGGSNLVGFQISMKRERARDYITDEDFITEEMIKNVEERFADDIKIISILLDSSRGTTRFRREDLDLVIYAVNPGYIYNNSYEMVAGRYITDKDVARKLNVCVISDKQAEKLYGSVKDAIGQTLNIKMLNNSYDFTVVGIYEYKMTAMMSAMVNMSGEDWNNEVYIPYTTMSKFYNNSESLFYYYYAFVNDGVDPAAFCEEVTNYMNNRWYRNNDSVEIMWQTMEAQMEMINSALGIVSMVIAIIAGVSL